MEKEVFRLLETAKIRRQHFHELFLERPSHKKKEKFIFYDAQVFTLKLVLERYERILN